MMAALALPAPNSSRSSRGTVLLLLVVVAVCLQQPSLASHHCRAAPWLLLGVPLVDLGTVGTQQSRPQLLLLLLLVVGQAGQLQAK